MSAWQAIGDGKMMTSWIDIDDLVAIYAFVLEQKCEGVFNATSPEPLTNYDFTKILGKCCIVQHSFLYLHLLSKYFLEKAQPYYLIVKRSILNLLSEKGFVFKYPDLESSLKKILA